MHARPQADINSPIVPAQQRPHDPANQPAAKRRAAGATFTARHVLRQLMRQARDGQRLQPHGAGAGERGEEDAVAAEEGVLDAGHGHDLEAHRALEGADVARVNAQVFARRQVFADQFAGKLQPRRAAAAELLQHEAAAAEDARAQRLLKAHADRHLRRGAEKAVPMHHVLIAGVERHRHDVARHLGGERHFTRGACGPVLGHEQRASADHALERAEQAATAAHLRVRAHLDG